ncbi:MAG: pseudouridine synthase [Dysosmobacter welbionis]
MPEAVEIMVDGPCCTAAATPGSCFISLRGPLRHGGRPGATVLDLLPPELRRRGLFPVGRLDKDTEGLLLLTNEGGLAHDILSPKHHVDKVYYARTAGCLTEEDCRAFAAGMTLGGGLECLPAGLEILRRAGGQRGAGHPAGGEVSSGEADAGGSGKPVLYLKRVRMGNLPSDPALEPGTYRYLTEDEVESLRNF